jgi:hypothetical protein
MGQTWDKTRVIPVFRPELSNPRFPFRKPGTGRDVISQFQFRKVSGLAHVSQPYLDEAAIHK